MQSCQNSKGLSAIPRFLVPQDIFEVLAQFAEEGNAFLSISTHLKAKVLSEIERIRQCLTVNWLGRYNGFVYWSGVLQIDFIHSRCTIHSCYYCGLQLRNWFLSNPVYL